MKKFIVCTTINEPTKAIEIYDSLSDWNLVVVGDLKTPKDYKLKNGVYLTPNDQNKMNSNLSELIGWNCIQRRNMGLLYAYNCGADLIATVDDDNIPLSNWGKNVYINESILVKEYQTEFEVFDPIGATNYKHLWHRGFPLELIASREYSEYENKYVSPSIQANFWNGDPDIDAVCRLEHKPECSFNEEHFPFSSNRISPFNSQNTILSRNVIPDYFLFPHIGRMDDIWASYYVQSLGHKVVYDIPTVYQDRNVHNLIDDMKKEYLGYENNLNLVHDLNQDPKNIEKYLPEKTKASWSAYRNALK